VGERREGPHDHNFPGPGYYSPLDGVTHEKAPEWKISDNPNGSHQGPTVTSNNLGPGQYNDRSYIGEGPQYTMGYKRDGPHDPNYPGPGYYTTNDG
jgi:hypothetical protein